MPGIPCRLFVSSRLLFDPLATTAIVFTQTNTKATRRGECGQDPCPHEQREPQDWNCRGARWVLASICPHPVAVPGRAPLAAGCCRSVALGSGRGREKTPTCARASAGGEAGSCPRVANHSSPPCWSLRAAVTVAEAFKKPRCLPPLPHAAAGFREKALWSTAPLHSAF